MVQAIAQQYAKVRIPEPPSWAENETSSSREEPSDLTNAGDNKAVLAIFTVLIFSVEVANHPGSQHLFES